MAPRNTPTRSKRSRQTRSLSPTSDYESSRDYSPPPPVKKRRTKPVAEIRTPQKPRGNRGRLRQMTELPLDILFEVILILLLCGSLGSGTLLDLLHGRTIGPSPTLSRNKDSPTLDNESICGVDMESLVSEFQERRIVGLSISGTAP
jgi:hypothetical protein